MENTENMSAGEKVEKHPISGFVTLGKDSLSLLRDSTLFLLALLLMVFPTTFNNILTKAGFEEGSFVGLKWKSKLVDSNTALNEANVTISELKKQLDATSKALTEAQSKINDPTLNQTVTKLDEQKKALDDSTNKVQASVISTIASNALFVEKAQKAADINTKWGVVFGGDTDLKGAKDEVEREAPRFGIPNPTIYHRQGSYRSVSVLNTRDDAQAALARAKQRRNDAYIVSISTWCPNSTQKEGYVECVSP